MERPDLSIAIRGAVFFLFLTRELIIAPSSSCLSLMNNESGGLKTKSGQSVHPAVHIEIPGICDVMLAGVIKESTRNLIIKDFPYPLDVYCFFRSLILNERFISFCQCLLILSGAIQGTHMQESRGHINKYLAHEEPRNVPFCLLLLISLVEKMD